MIKQRRKQLDAKGDTSNGLLHVDEQFSGKDWTRFFANGTASETRKASSFSLPNGDDRWVPRYLCWMERVAGSALFVKVPVWSAKEEGIPL